MEGSVRNLLDAEKESQAIIEQALKEKTKRITEAKVYAEQDLNRFRKELDEKYEIEAAKKKQENEELAQVDRQVQEEIKQIKADFEMNKRQVIKMLLDQILVVNIEVPKVVQQKFE